MTESQKIVLEILKASLWGKSIEIPENTNWEQVLEDMRVQTVSELAADWVSSRNDIPADVKDKWLKLSLAQLGVYYRIIFEQNSLYKLLTDNGIPMAVIKGAAACIYYSNPHRRRMGDIDFIVPADDFNRASKLMLENGFVTFVGSHIKNLHIAYLKNDIDFELHRRVQGINEGKDWEKVSHIFDMAAFPPQIHSLGGYDFATFPHIQNGLIILLHIKHHMLTGLGLRQIIDWMMYVSDYLDDEHFRFFAEFANELGIINFAKTVTRMCQLYLGLTVENRTWCFDADESVISSLMDWIMDKGNFGRREDYWERKGKNALMNKSGLFRRFKFMQSVGLQKWDAARKCILLRPFAWIYELRRYLEYIFARPKPIRSLFSDFRAAKKQKKFVQKLIK